LCRFLLVITIPILKGISCFSNTIMPSKLLKLFWTVGLRVLSIDTWINGLPSLKALNRANLSSDSVLSIVPFVLMLRRCVEKVILANSKISTISLRRKGSPPRKITSKGDTCLSVLEITNFKSSNSMVLPSKGPA